MKRRVAVRWNDGRRAIIDHDNPTDVIVAWLELSDHIVGMGLGAGAFPESLAREIAAAAQAMRDHATRMTGC